MKGKGKNIFSSAHLLICKLLAAACVDLIQSFPPLLFIFLDGNPQEKCMTLVQIEKSSICEIEKIWIAFWTPSLSEVILA